MKRRRSRDHAWLDAPLPLDLAQSRRQIRTLLKLLGSKPKRVLDLGCGGGRVLVPLARAGHKVVGVDRLSTVLAECRRALAETHATARLIEADFRRPLRLKPGFDAVLCLGRTFLMLADVDEAAAWVTRMAALLNQRGMLVLDDLPRDLWPELTEGRWQNGLSRDRRMQLVWRPGDSVLAIRTGPRIDARRWTLKRGDTPLRLWCDGSLALLARLARLSGPHRPRGGELLVFRRLIQPRRAPRASSR